MNIIRLANNPIYCIFYGVIVSITILPCSNLFTTKNNHDIWLNEPVDEPISALSHQCYAGYYYMSRLFRIINSIPKLTVHFNQDFFNLPYKKYNHKDVQASYLKSTEEGNFNSVQDLWKKVGLYDYLNDLLFMEEFTSYLCDIMIHAYNTTLQPLKHHSNTLTHTNIEQNIHLCHSYLDYIEIHNQKSSSYTVYEPSLIYTEFECRPDHSHATQLYKHDTTDYVRITQSEHVALRYYLITNLAETFSFLLDHAYLNINNLIVDNNIVNFHNTSIKLNSFFGQACIDAIIRTQSISPIFHYWEKMQEFIEIENIDFIKDLLKIILIIRIAIIDSFDQKLIPSKLSSNINFWLNHINTFKTVEFINIFREKKDTAPLKKRNITPEQNPPQFKPKRNGFLEKINDEIGINHAVFACLVARRFYFIQRLTPIMQRLIQLGTIQYDSQKIINYDFYNRLNSDKPLPLIQKNKPFTQDYNLKPLFLYWNEFISYAAIQDQIIVDHFSQEILLVSNPNHFFQPSNLSLKPTKSNNDALYYNIPLEKDLDIFASINAVFSRIYLNAQLANIIPFLATLPYTQYSHASFNKIAFDCTHPHLKEMLASMKETSSLRPLITTFKLLNNYYFIKGDINIEFINIVNSILDTLITNLDPSYTMSPLSHSNEVENIKNIVLKKKLLSDLLQSYYSKQSLIQKITTWIYQMIHKWPAIKALK